MWLQAGRMFQIPQQKTKAGIPLDGLCTSTCFRFAGLIYCAKKQDEQKFVPLLAAGLPSTQPPSSTTSLGISTPCWSPQSSSKKCFPPCLGDLWCLWVLGRRWGLTSHFCSLVILRVHAIEHDFGKTASVSHKVPAPFSAWNPSPKLCSLTTLTFPYRWQLRRQEKRRDTTPSSREVRGPPIPR